MADSVKKRGPLSCAATGCFAVLVGCCLVGILALIFDPRPQPLDRPPRVEAPQSVKPEIGDIAVLQGSSESILFATELYAHGRLQEFLRAKDSEGVAELRRIDLAGMTPRGTRCRVINVLDGGKLLEVRLLDGPEANSLAIVEAEIATKVSQ